MTRRLDARSDRPSPAGTGDPSSRTATDPERPVSVPARYASPGSSTGTVDDQDEPEDEQDGENEASVRESSDQTEAPGEFWRDDED